MFILDRKFVDGIVGLHKDLKDLESDWALWGKLGEALLNVEVVPEKIEIITTGEGAKEIHELVREHNPTKLSEIGRAHV